MKLFDKFRPSASVGVANVNATSSELSGALSNLSFKPTFIVGYVSPHVDIEGVARTVTSRFPGIPLVLCSTAGELCRNGDSLYCGTGERWDHIALQCFDASIIERVQLVSVPLGCEDLRRGKSEVTMKERVARISRSLENVRVEFPIDHRDTFAYVLFDGISSSESFFMEALYESGRFPCLFVGGSAGGKLDFQHTWIHDGQKKLENHALIAFAKVAKGTRFGVFKSQNFEPANAVFHVIHATTEQRYISNVITPAGRIVSLIDALCTTLHCVPHELASKLEEYSFAIRVGKQLFVRSVHQIDLERGHIHFLLRRGAWRGIAAGAAYRFCGNHIA